ncbi:hypothetical protein EV421DRAFT_1859789 [Armillaria borealis]|uniref:Uncharacterized protein n=1 Tax=Armillaria borealis TaxID=47425 RepID=A0AA39IW21_9AGAR|nr:hypothetical protein EV421DRAFT_1859789 [Armillaria borealis]
MGTIMGGILGPGLFALRCNCFCVYMHHDLHSAKEVEGGHGIPSSSGQPRATLTALPIKNARPKLCWKCREPI